MDRAIDVMIKHLKYKVGNWEILTRIFLEINWFHIRFQKLSVPAIGVWTWLSGGIHLDRSLHRALP